MVVVHAYSTVGQEHMQLNDNDDEEEEARTRMIDLRSVDMLIFQYLHKQEIYDILLLWDIDYVRFVHLAHHASSICNLHSCALDHLSTRKTLDMQH